MLAAVELSAIEVCLRERFGRTKLWKSLIAINVDPKAISRAGKRMEE
jgi:hypothetical protein